MIRSLSAVSCVGVTSRDPTSRAVAPATSIIIRAQTVVREHLSAQCMLNHFLSPPASTTKGALPLNTLVYWPGQPVNIIRGTFVIALAVGTPFIHQQPCPSGAACQSLELLSSDALLPILSTCCAIFRTLSNLVPCSLPTGHTTLGRRHIHHQKIREQEIGALVQVAAH